LKKAILLTLGLSITLSAQTMAKNKVVYGEDNRVDAEKTSNPLYAKLAKSTAGQIAFSKLTDQGDHYSFDKVTIKQQKQLCEGERFAEQFVAPRCSGFLVGPNLLVTAGHCVQPSLISDPVDGVIAGDDCADNAWVFGYTNTSSKSGKIDKKNVYKCKKILNQALDSSTSADYALIELDREVEGREPLKFRTEGKVEVNADIVVIGHPSGLPSKVADGAKVLTNDNAQYFTSDLDTFGGNSGSAVFDARTGLVEGILVRGAKDYLVDYSRWCRVVNDCTEVKEGTICYGESVSKITVVEIEKYMKKSSQAK